MSAITDVIDVTAVRPPLVPTCARLRAADTATAAPWAAPVMHDAKHTAKHAGTHTNVLGSPPRGAPV
jgi:hypothetical protein